MRIAIIIPALEPGTEFTDIVKGLEPGPDRQVIVVNDGSGAEYDGVFDAIALLPYCTVLRHEQNLGKGAALKTAIGVFRERFKDFDGAVTADCDGQHTISDILRVADKVCENRGGIVLGERDFSGEDVPFKSRYGNRLTAFLFEALYGQRVNDTQTGLRGFASALMPWLMSIKGDRFEYEMRVLTEGSRRGVPIVSVPIETVYDDKENHSTHFRALRDSARVYWGLFESLGGYLASSGVSALVDYGLFLLLNILVFRDLAPSVRILLATVIARVCSSLLNFTLNKGGVFKSEGHVKERMGRYYLLFASQMAASYGITLLISSVTPMSANVAKLLVDAVIAVVSYQLQMRWVFKNDNQPVIGG